MTVLTFSQVARSFQAAVDDAKKQLLAMDVRLLRPLLLTLNAMSGSTYLPGEAHLTRREPPPVSLGPPASHDTILLPLYSPICSDTPSRTSAS